MPISEAARHDLYNGLAEILGPERAETLMTQLPRYDPSDVATKSDIAELRSDIAELGAATKSDMARIEGDLDDLKGGQVVLHSRIDRLFLTLVAGLFAIVATMAGFVITAL